MTVYYEWDVEIIADEDSEDFYKGDVVEHLFKKSFKEYLEECSEPAEAGFRKQIVCVRDDDVGRSWCYYDTKLDAWFYDAYAKKVCKTPCKLLRESGSL